MYLLDTNIISYILYHPENYPYLMHKVRTTKQRDMYICTVTVAEMVQWRLSGINRNNKLKYTVELYRHLGNVMDDLGKLQRLDPDEAALQELIKIPSSIRCGFNDKLIAAIAIANNCTLVTANVRHFEDIPNLKVEDWTARPLE